eukprot:GILK01008512.1.p1 GENE.GILK01008512.1~~GILK01008512.1.p1  ORF type:complete len:664 (-),score=68.88 GILK01008512.1:209-2134(-)
MSVWLCVSVLLSVVVSCAHADDDQCGMDVFQLFETQTYPTFDPSLGSIMRNASAIPGKPLGDFDACVGLPGSVAEYVTIDVQTSGQSFPIGACLPSSCNEAGLTALAPAIIQQFSLPKDTVLSFTIAQDIQWDAGGITMLVICGLFISSVFLASAASCLVFGDVKPKSELNEPLLVGESTSTTIRTTTRQSSVINKLIDAFSLSKNVAKLSFTPPSSSFRHLQSLNFLRVISMFWIILGHTHSFLSSRIENLKDVIEATKTVPFQLVTSAFFAVDIFFWLSGFLVSYLVLLELQKKGSIPIGKYYIHRYWRLTPVYAFTLFMLWKVSVHMGTGPGFNQFQSFQENSCGSYWWTNLLYINNFYAMDNFNNECMGWGWYLGNDMMFYIVTPIYLIAYHKHKITGLLLIAASFIASVAVSSVLIVDNGFTASIVNPGSEYFNMYYEKPYCRCIPYLLGMLSAMALIQFKGKLNLKPSVRYIGYLCSIATLLATVFGTYRIYHDGTSAWSVADNTVYLVWSKVGFCMALSFVFYCCMSGYATRFNNFCSLGIWSPLAKLTFGAYLLHPVIMEVYMFNLRVLIHYDGVTIVWLFIGFVVMAYLSSLFMFLFIESPLVGVEKLWSGSAGKSTEIRVVKIDPVQEKVV